MGIVRMGIPTRLVEFIIAQHGVDTFIETGTFQGGTAAWASQVMKKVFTIEFSPDIYQETSHRLRHLENVEFAFGDSRQVLRSLMPQVGPSIIWLDAHWCEFGSYGEHDQCPLLEELEIVNESSADHFILIDDARLFLAPPPLPNSCVYYPDIAAVVNSLTNGRKRAVFVHEDVIIAVPDSEKQRYQRYLQEETSRDSERRSAQHRLHSSRRFRDRMKKSFYLGKELLKVWTGDLYPQIKKYALPAGFRNGQLR